MLFSSVNYEAITCHIVLYIVANVTNVAQTYSRFFKDTSKTAGEDSFLRKEGSVSLLMIKLDVSFVLINKKK